MEDILQSEILVQYLVYSGSDLSLRKYPIIYALIYTIT